MKQRFRLFRRGSKFWTEDAQTGKQESLRTGDRHEALTLLHAKNESFRQPAINLQIAQSYLRAIDPEIGKRTWQFAMDEIVKLKHGPTQERYIAAFFDEAFDLIRRIPLLQTHSSQILKVLEVGTVSTNVFLRRVHNFALDMQWLPWPLVPNRQWPKVKFKEKRAITLEEHQRIVAREKNPQWNAFYRMCWHVGASQSDLAQLRAEDVDRENRLISYSRRKNGKKVRLHFGKEVELVLNDLPRSGLLFPRLAELHERHRAKLFNRRCKLLGISGITLHSYRYAWAERARIAGYPERFAQEALGHSSEAVHRAYAKRAEVMLPSLEEYCAAQAKRPEGDLRQPSN
jgi:integrase